MSPLIISHYETPIGALEIVTRGDTVLVCEFADKEHRVQRQMDRYHADTPPIARPLPAAVEAELASYFAGDIKALDRIKTDAGGTAYERSVWQRLRLIPAGATATYGALALELASSARAVGRANGRNPVAVIHPCHRVIGANGSLTGYAGGLERKDWLLKHEGAR